MPATPYKRHFTVANSAARTATLTSSAYNSKYHRGVRLTLHATALAATPSIVMKIQGQDQTSEAWFDILEDAAVTTAAPTTSTLLVHPDAPATANVSASDYLPTKWRVVVTAGDADSITYSIGAELLP